MVFIEPKHTLFLLEKDGDRRAYIRQCLAAIGQIKRVHPYQAVERALEALSTYTPRIIVLSSEMFDAMSPAQMDALRQSTSKDPVAIVVTLPCDQRFGEDLARRMVRGADAFFVEPFISHEMAQVVSLVSGDEIAPPAKRVTATLSHLVSRLKSVIDSLAYELLAHGRPGRARAEVKKLTTAIRTLPSEYHESFFELMQKEFDEAPILGNYQSLLAQRERDAKILEELNNRDRAEAAKVKARNNEARRIIRK